MKYNVFDTNKVEKNKKWFDKYCIAKDDGFLHIMDNRIILFELENGSLVFCDFGLKMLQSF